MLCDEPCRTLSDLSFSLASVHLDSDAATVDKMSQLAAAVMMNQPWAKAGNQRLHNVTGLTNNLQVRHWPKQLTHSSCLGVFEAHADAGISWNWLPRQYRMHGAHHNQPGWRACGLGHMRFAMNGGPVCAVAWNEAAAAAWLCVFVLCPQGYECNYPDSGPHQGYCFFDHRMWKRIQSRSGGSETFPSVTLEESEFALPLEHLATFMSDMQKLAFDRSALNGATWPLAFILMRPGGSTTDLLHPAATTGTTPQRVVWVELGTFRPNITLPGTQLRVQKRLPGLQEAFEQLMVCK